MRRSASVQPTLLGRPVRYLPLPEDMEHISEAVALLVRMLFVAGADEV